MQYLIFELRSRIAPMESRGRPADIFTHLKIGSQGLHVATLDGNN